VKSIVVRLMPRRVFIGHLALEDIQNIILYPTRVTEEKHCYYYIKTCH